MSAKRAVSAALALLLVVAIPARAGIVPTYSADGFYYTVAGSNATVTGCTFACPTTLVIPSTLGGYTVTSIGDTAFSTDLLATVTIGDSVKSIGASAFYNNVLTAVTIGDSVTSYGAYAFGSNHLTSFTIGNSVASIGDGAFYGNALTAVTFLGNAPAAGVNVFQNNVDLVKVVRYSTATGWGVAWGGVAVETVSDPRTVPTLSFTKPANVLLGIAPFSLFATTNNSDNSTVTFTVDVGSSGVCRVSGSTVTITGAGTCSITASRSATANFLAPTPVAQSFTVTIPDVRATATVKPTAIGTSTVGMTLTAAGTWAGYPTPTFTYQWYACTSAVSAARATVPSTCKKITGATRSTFKLTSAQRGKYVAVYVTGTSLRTVATTWLSKTTAKVR